MLGNGWGGNKQEDAAKQQPIKQRFHRHLVVYA
jgi:hypothetical protein